MNCKLVLALVSVKLTGDTRGHRLVRNKMQVGNLIVFSSRRVIMEINFMSVMIAYKSKVWTGRIEIQIIGCAYHRKSQEFRIHCMYQPEVHLWSRQISQLQEGRIQLASYMIRPASGRRSSDCYHTLLLSNFVHSYPKFSNKRHLLQIRRFDLLTSRHFAVSPSG